MQYVGQQGSCEGPKAVTIEDTTQHTEHWPLNCIHCTLNCTHFTLNCTHFTLNCSHLILDTERGTLKNAHCTTCRTSENCIDSKFLKKKTLPDKKTTCLGLCFLRAETSRLSRNFASQEIYSVTVKNCVNSQDPFQLFLKSSDCLETIRNFSCFMESFNDASQLSVGKNKC